MDELLLVKNWERFQHYKKQNPPWIRFYKSTLVDHEMASLTIPSRLLMTLLWLLASENNGVIKNDVRMISFRVHLPEDVVGTSLTELIKAGFLVATNLSQSVATFSKQSHSVSELSVSVSASEDGGVGEGEKNVFVSLPVTLDTPVFRQVWMDWEKHLAENNRRMGLMQRPTAWHELIAKTPKGHHPGPYAVDVLRRCIANGWKTIVHPESNGKHEPPKKVYRDYTAERLAQAKKESA